MNKNKNFLSLEEVPAYLFSKKIEADIISVPPDIAYQIDEEHLDDDHLNTPVVVVVVGTLEITIPDDIAIILNEQIP